MLLRSLLFGCFVLYCSQQAGILMSWVWSNSTDESTDVVAFNDLPTSDGMKIDELLINAVEEKSLDCLRPPYVEMDQYPEKLTVGLQMIKEQAKFIHENIEWNIDSVVAQIDEATIRYNQSFEKLRKINATIYSAWSGIESTLSKVDEKLAWINESIGEKSEQLTRAYRIFHHIVYLLGAMIIAAFLQAPLTTRLAIIGIIPPNFMIFLKYGTEVYLDFTSMTLLICLITGLNLFIRFSQDEETWASNILKTNSRLRSIIQMFAIVIKENIPSMFHLLGIGWWKNNPDCADNCSSISKDSSDAKGFDVPVDQTDVWTKFSSRLKLYAHPIASGIPGKSQKGYKPLYRDGDGRLLRRYSRRTKRRTVVDIKNTEATNPTKAPGLPSVPRISWLDSPLKKGSDSSSLINKEAISSDVADIENNEATNSTKQARPTSVPGISFDSIVKKAPDSFPSNSEETNFSIVADIKNNEATNRAKQLRPTLNPGISWLDSTVKKAPGSLSSNSKETNCGNVADIKNNEATNRTKKPRPILIPGISWLDSTVKKGSDSSPLISKEANSGDVADIKNNEATNSTKQARPTSVPGITFDSIVKKAPDSFPSNSEETNFSIVADIKNNEATNRTKQLRPTLNPGISWLDSTVKKAPGSLSSNSKETNFGNVADIKNNEATNRTKQPRPYSEPLKELPENLPFHCQKKDSSTLSNLTRNETLDRKNQPEGKLVDGIPHLGQSLQGVPMNPSSHSEKTILTTLEKIAKNKNSDLKKKTVGSSDHGISCSGQPSRDVLANFPVCSEKKKINTLECVLDANLRSLCEKEEANKSLVEGSLWLREPARKALEKRLSNTPKEISKQESLETKSLQPISIDLSIRVDNRTDARNSVRPAQYECNSTVSFLREILQDPFAHRQTNAYGYEPLYVAPPVTSGLPNSWIQGGSSRCRPPSSGLCGAMTQKGTPCRNKPSYGGSTCWRH